MKRRIYTWIVTWEEIGFECVRVGAKPPWRSQIARCLSYGYIYGFDFYKYTS